MTWESLVTRVNSVRSFSSWVLVEIEFGCFPSTRFLQTCPSFQFSLLLWVWDCFSFYSTIFSVIAFNSGCIIHYISGKVNHASIILQYLLYICILYILHLLQQCCRNLDSSSSQVTLRPFILIIHSQFQSPVSLNMHFFCDNKTCRDTVRGLSCFKVTVCPGN